MLNDRGEQILAQFPDPVTVRPVLTASVAIFIAVSALFAIACLGGAWHSWHTKGFGSPTWGLIFIAALFAFFAAGSVRMLRTDSITLDREGFVVVLGLRKRASHFPWKDVSAFETQYFPKRMLVVAFDDVRKSGVFAAADRAFGFRNTNLLEDYGLGEQQLCELLNRWRECALAKASGERATTASGVPRIRDLS